MHVTPLFYANPDIAKRFGLFNKPVLNGSLAEISGRMHKQPKSSQ